jgi:drug/metabolite transporter (DMT)-like permease
MMAAGFGRLLPGQRLTPRLTPALAIRAAGALWVIFRGDVAAPARLDPGQGTAISFWGGLAHAAYSTMLRKLNRGEPAAIATFGTLVAGCVLLALGGFRSILSTDWAALPQIFWITLVFCT